MKSEHVNGEGRTLIMEINVCQITNYPTLTEVKEVINVSMKNCQNFVLGSRKMDTFVEVCSVKVMDLVNCLDGY